MRTFSRYALRRFGQFVLVVFVGINLAFFITQGPDLGFASPTSKIPPTQQHRVPLARVIELQQRLLGERTDA